MKNDITHEIQGMVDEERIITPHLYSSTHPPLYLAPQARSSSHSHSWWDEVSPPPRGNEKKRKRLR
jgi:hypothetical protein